jgi:ATP-dependent protease ClpP protease subunit
MSDTPAAGKPGAVKTVEGRPAPGKAGPLPTGAALPHAVVGRVNAAKAMDMGGGAAPPAGGHFVVGDRVECLVNHMDGMKGMTGKIALAESGPYFAVEFDNPMDGMPQPHKWLAQHELARSETDQKAVSTCPPQGRIVMARQRPAAMPVPADRRVAAYTKSNVLDKWSEDAAGVRAVAKGDNVVTMFGEIGEDWWTGEGVTAKNVTAQLRAIGDRPIEVQINSAGGDVFEGFAIYNVLREHPQAITVKIMGMAASAASVIAMAGDTIEIGVAAFLMIHNCWCGAVGNRHDFQEVVDFLEPFDLAMAQVYTKVSGQPIADVQKWMDAETFMSGQAAIDRGFASALLPADQTKRDEKAKASDRERAAITALELKLLASGDTRAQARAHIAKIKGKPDAALDTVDKPDAADPELTASMAGLLASFQK